jgi:hypothetical protein
MSPDPWGVGQRSGGSAPYIKKKVTKPSAPYPPRVPSRYPLSSRSAAGVGQLLWWVNFPLKQGDPTHRSLSFRLPVLTLSQSAERGPDFRELPSGLTAASPVEPSVGAEGTPAKPVRKGFA